MARDITGLGGNGRATEGLGRVWYSVRLRTNCEPHGTAELAGAMVVREGATARAGVLNM